MIFRRIIHIKRYFNPNFHSILNGKESEEKKKIELLLNTLMEGCSEKGSDRAPWEEFKKRCIDFPELITVFEPYKLSAGADEPAESLETSILEALFKSRAKDRDKSALIEVKLAIHWDRIDKAKATLFSVQFQPSLLISKAENQISKDSLFQIALERNRVQFVRDFIERGVIITKFLTIDMLNQLYNHIV